MTRFENLEMRKAFMGGLVAWVIQVLIVTVWIFTGGHSLAPRPSGSLAMQPAALGSPGAGIFPAPALGVPESSTPSNSFAGAFR